MTDMLIIINHHGIIMKINKKMEELSNYSEFELISDDINKVLLCEDRRWYKKITKDNLLNFETSVLTKKGDIIPANIFTSIMKDEDEGDVGIIIIGQDIRLTRQLENEIEEREIAEKILKESEERYKTLVTKIPEVILIHKYDLIVYVNQSIEFLIGYSPEEVIGTTLFKYVYDEYKPILMQNLKKRLAGEELPDHEMVIIDKNGNKKTVIFRSTTTIYDNQLMFLSLLIDITERKRNEEDLRKAKESAEIANKTKSEFLATMSHEIRTPINGILGMLSLTSNTPLSEEQKKYMTMARTSCEYLANVVESILDYSRIEAGKIEIENVDFDLYKLMNQVLEEFKIKADEKKLNISLKIARDVDKYINGDVNKLKQILVNLVNNAVKFTEKGSVEIEVEKNNDLCDKIELKFIIKDTGIGIAREKINKLFQTFSQADSSSKRKYGGTGLGLAISKKLVEMMKGNIWLYTEESVGTTFYFTCILGKSDKDSCRNDEDISEEEFENKKTIKILIAEDNVVNQEFMSVLLSKKGYIVECVDNGLEVLEKLETGTYDLILMDVEMPEMDGIETTSKIRENERENNIPNIPIIALTAYAMKGDKDKCMKAGMNDYISKPIKVDLLFSKMEKIIS